MNEGAGFEVTRLRELPAGGLTHFMVESERAGHRFLRRLLDDWQSGANRFDRPGEALFAAVADGRIVGVCGLNEDPYLPGARTGRVRHLYVEAGWRRRGIGRRLVAEVVGAARGRFEHLRLRTDREDAARFYEALGFRACPDAAEQTHILELKP